MAVEIKALMLAVIVIILLQVVQLAVTRGLQSRWMRRFAELAGTVAAIEGRVTAMENDLRPGELRAVRALLEEKFADERKIVQEHLRRHDGKLDEVLECLHDLRSARQS